MAMFPMGMTRQFLCPECWVTERNITDNFLISCHGMQSFAIDHDLTLAGDEQLKDFFHFGAVAVGFLITLKSKHCIWVVYCFEYFLCQISQI